MHKIRTVRCANYTANLGETFRFALLRNDGRPRLLVQTGTVQRIHPAGGKMAIDMRIPALNCTHSYFASEIYYRGLPEEDKFHACDL